ncbi:MAG: hypothetical protein QOG52_1839 [Frankiaceae bacterium]|jgi:hypothetical protein|nr:hypothetical protein [Frankiaceae bacterium]
MRQLRKILGAIALTGLTAVGGVVAAQPAFAGVISCSTSVSAPSLSGGNVVATISASCSGTANIWLSGTLTAPDGSTNTSGNGGCYGVYSCSRTFSSPTQPGTWTMHLDSGTATPVTNGQADYPNTVSFSAKSASASIAGACSATAYNPTFDGTNVNGRGRISCSQVVSSLTVDVWLYGPYGQGGHTVATC